VRPVCLDHLSLHDVPALELIEIAAELGCDAVSLFVTPGALGPYLDLTRDKAAKADVLSALRGNGLAVGIVEPFMLTPDPDWDLLERSAAVAAELGGTVNALCFDNQPARQQDSFARLARIARAAGARMVVEGFTLSSVRTLAEALAIADTVGPQIGLTVDAHHPDRGKLAGTRRLAAGAHCSCPDQRWPSDRADRPDARSDGFQTSARSGRVRSGGPDPARPIQRHAGGRGSIRCSTRHDASGASPHHRKRDSRSACLSIAGADGLPFSSRRTRSRRVRRGGSRPNANCRHFVAGDDVVPGSLRPTSPTWLAGT